MIIYLDTLGIVLVIAIVILFCLAFTIIFSKKNNFANILVLLGGIQRYGMDVGFALKPYLIFSIFLFGGTFVLKDFRERIVNLVQILKPIAISISGLTISMLVSGMLTGAETETIRHYLLFAWNWAIVAAYLLYIQKTSELTKTHKVILVLGWFLAVTGLVIYILSLLGMENLVSPREGGGFVFRDINDKIDRLRLFEWDPNAYGLYILSLLFYSVGWALYSKHRNKKIFISIVLTILLCANVILTFSRGAFVSMVSGFAFLFLITGTNIKRTTRLIVTGILLLGVVYLLHNTMLFERATVGFTSRQGFYETRYSLWEKTIQLISENPFTGVGQGRLPDYINIQAHNSWLEMIAENGFMALIFIAWLLGIVMWNGTFLTRKLIKAENANGYILAGAVSGLFAMIVMLFSVSLITVIYFWFQIGFVLLLTWHLSKANGKEQVRIREESASHAVEGRH